MVLPQLCDISLWHTVKVKSSPRIQLQSLGKDYAYSCQSKLLLDGILGVYIHANPRLPLSIPSILIHTILLYMIDPENVTSLAYLEASQMPTPLSPLHLLSQLCYLNSASRTHLVLHGIKFLTRCSNFSPLSLCS